MKDEPEAFITGGQQIFQQSMSLVQRLYLTKIEHEFAGDTFFPELDENAWQIVNTDAHKADEKNHYDYTFLVLERKKL